MKKLLLISLLIILPLFISCRKGIHVSNPVLSLADSLMQTRSDSSLYLLEQISEPQNLDVADRAYYNLLLTQAKYKNCILLQNDSLIQIAIDYYRNNGDDKRLAKSYFYLGCVYMEQKKLPMAIELYLKAVDTMPEGRDSLFLSMIYSHLGDCYNAQNLNETAICMYQKGQSLCANHDSIRTFYFLKDIGDAFLLKYEFDSTYCYYQQSLKVALSLRKYELISFIYKNMATLFNQQGKYAEAEDCITKALPYLDNEEDFISACSVKGDIMSNMNRNDSAVYYWNIGTSSSNIYVKTSSYYSLFQESKKLKDWENATIYADSFITFYDSIQAMNDRAELDKLMDNYSIELYKYKLSVKNKRLSVGLIVSFAFLASILIIIYLWRDRCRREKYVAFQQKLMTNRTETLLLNDASDTTIKEKNKELYKLEEERLEICISLFQSTEGYHKLCELTKSTPKIYRSLVTNYRLRIICDIRKSFVDVMADFKTQCPSLTNDDLLYCILVLLNTSKEVILDIMKSTPDAIKTRKSRIKNKMQAELFERIFVF